MNVPKPLTPEEEAVWRREDEQSNSANRRIWATLDAERAARPDALPPSLVAEIENHYCGEECSLRDAMDEIERRFLAVPAPALDARIAAFVQHRLGLYVLAAEKVGGVDPMSVIRDRDPYLADAIDAVKGLAAAAPALDAEAMRDLREAIRGRIESIEHPCHEACVESPPLSGNYTMHADCQCAAWMRQEAIDALAAAGGGEAGS